MMTVAQGERDVQAGAHGGIDHMAEPLEHGADIRPPLHGPGHAIGDQGPIPRWTDDPAADPREREQAIGGEQREAANLQHVEDLQAEQVGQRIIEQRSPVIPVPPQEESPIRLQLPGHESGESGKDEDRDEPGRERLR